MKKLRFSAGDKVKHNSKGNCIVYLSVIDKTLKGKASVLSPILNGKDYILRLENGSSKTEDLFSAFDSELSPN
jgi:hypothetical protein